MLAGNSKIPLLKTKHLTHQITAMFTTCFGLCARHCREVMILSEVTAFILCGGLGTRLRSVVSDCPKSMARIGQRPFLAIQLRQLQLQGLRHVVLGTGYLSKQIEDYFGDGTAFGLAIQYSPEPHPLGTGGAIRLGLDKFSNSVLILNGDSYCECDFAALARFYENCRADFTMVIRKVENANRYGRVKVGRDDQLEGFEEKDGAAAPGWMNAGIYLCKREIIACIPLGLAVSFERETIPAILNRSCRVFPTAGPFIDIGIPEDYDRAQTLLADF
jgi:D-glycero-alpha-D-manno-heptose 1-phosphate guanylyltransferase